MGSTPGSHPQVTQLLSCSTPLGMSQISYLVPLSAIDTASLSTSLGVAIYLALIAGFRGEQIVFILLLRGRKVGPFPKAQARNTVSGGRKAENSITNSCFEKENSIALMHSPCGTQTQGEDHALHGLCRMPYGQDMPE